jgi:hypothetical protein
MRRQKMWALLLVCPLFFFHHDYIFRAHSGYAVPLGRELYC